MSREEETQMLQIVKDLYSTVNEIRKSQESIKQNQDVKNSELSAQMSELRATLAPIAELYGSFKGFGSVGNLLMKFVIIPSSVIIGLILSFRSLLIPHN